jgi:hypothetical protein
MLGFRSIVGVDQTGAVGAKGQPKPLYASLLCLSDLSLRTILKLPSLNYVSVRSLIGEENFPVLVVVDSVLGLPDVAQCLEQLLLAKEVNHATCYRQQAFFQLVAATMDINEKLSDTF